MSTDWKSLDHRVSKEYEKYVVMLAEVGSANNELELIARYQKIVKAISDDAEKRGLSQAYRLLDELITQESTHIRVSELDAIRMCKREILRARQGR